MLAKIGQVFFAFIFIIVSAAYIRSCFFSGDSRSARTLGELPIVEYTETNPKHERIMTALNSILLANGLMRVESESILFIHDEEELNAASFGNGMYLFWEEMSELSSWAIDGIVAHEVAHDQLLHAQKQAELSDLVNFFSEVIGLFGGADYRAQQALNEWSEKLTIPSYSRLQELEADDVAVSLLKNVGYSTPAKNMAATLKILLETYGNTGGGFFDSHPSTDERIQRLHAK